MMSNLICGELGGLDDLHMTCGARKACADVARHRVQPQEPVYVHVRIRQYVDPAPGSRAIPPGRPGFGRLPVGCALDCYL